MDGHVHTARQRCVRTTVGYGTPPMLAGAATDREEIWNEEWIHVCNSLFIGAYHNIICYPAIPVQK